MVDDGMRQVVMGSDGLRLVAYDKNKAKSLLATGHLIKFRPGLTVVTINNIRL